MPPPLKVAYRLPFSSYNHDCSPPHTRTPAPTATGTAGVLGSRRRDDVGMAYPYSGNGTLHSHHMTAFTVPLLQTICALGTITTMHRTAHGTHMWARIRSPCGPTCKCTAVWTNHGPCAARGLVSYTQTYLALVLLATHAHTLRVSSLGARQRGLRAARAGAVQVRHPAGHRGHPQGRRRQLVAARGRPHSLRVAGGAGAGSRPAAEAAQVQGRHARQVRWALPSFLELTRLTCAYLSAQGAIKLCMHF